MFDDILGPRVPRAFEPGDYDDEDHEVEIEYAAVDEFRKNMSRQPKVWSTGNRPRGVWKT